MTIELREETEKYLEDYLLQEGLQKDAMSEIVEEAIEDFLFRRMLDDTAKRNTDLNPEEVETFVQDVIAEDRQAQRTN